METAWFIKRQMKFRLLIIPETKQIISEKKIFDSAVAEVVSGAVLEVAFSGGEHVVFDQPVRQL